MVPMSCFTRYEEGLSPLMMPLTDEAEYTMTRPNTTRAVVARMSVRRGSIMRAGTLAATDESQSDAPRAPPAALGASLAGALAAPLSLRARLTGGPPPARGLGRGP